MTETADTTIIPLRQIVHGEQIHHGEYSRVYEVIGHPELVLKRSTSGLLPDEVARIFPDTQKAIEAGETIIPLDMETVFAHTPYDTVDMTHYAHIPEFYIKQGAYRAFAEGVALHVIAAQIPEVKGHVTSLHSIYLQKLQSKYHFTLLMDKVLRKDGEEERARDLHTVIDELRNLPLNERFARTKQLLGHLRGVAQALDILSQANPSIKHRDIAAKNLLLENEGTDEERLVIADFGLVLFDDQTLKREGMGTFFYMAPETLEDSSQAKPQSDQYALTQIAALLLGVLDSYTMLSTDQTIPKVDRNFWDIKKNDKHPFISRGYLVRELCNRWGDQNTIEFETAIGNVADVLIKGGDRQPAERFNTSDEMLSTLIQAFGPLRAK